MPLSITAYRSYFTTAFCKTGRGTKLLNCEGSYTCYNKHNNCTMTLSAGRHKVVWNQYFQTSNGKTLQKPVQWLVDGKTKTERVNVGK